MNNPFVQYRTHPAPPVSSQKTGLAPLPPFPLAPPYPAAYAAGSPPSAFACLLASPDAYVCTQRQVVSSLEPVRSPIMRFCLKTAWIALFAMFAVWTAPAGLDAGGEPPRAAHKERRPRTRRTPTRSRPTTTSRPELLTMKDIMRMRHEQDVARRIVEKAKQQGVEFEVTRPSSGHFAAWDSSPSRSRPSRMPATGPQAEEEEEERARSSPARG